MDPIVSRIVDLLEKKSITRATLMKYLGLTGSVFSTWSNGKTHTYENYLDRIAEFLNVSVEYLRYGKENTRNSGSKSAPQTTPQTSGAASGAKRKVIKVKVVDGFKDDHLLPKSKTYLDMGGYTGYVDPKEWKNDDVVMVFFDADTLARIPDEYKADAYYTNDIWRSYNYGKEDLEILEKEVEVPEEALKEKLDEPESYPEFEPFYRSKSSGTDGDDGKKDDNDDDDFDENVDYLEEVLENFEIHNPDEFSNLHDLLPRRYQIYVDHMMYLLLKGEGCLDW